jgi:hypothetical protein
VTKLNSSQIIGFAILIAVATILSTDLLKAVAAQPCPAGPDCYPWGAEGPVAGVWSYASKTNYLLRGLAQLGLLIGAAAYLIWRAGRDQNLNLSPHTIIFAALGAAALLQFV